MIIGITYNRLQHVANRTRKQKNEASQKNVVAINYEVKDDRSKYKHEVVQSYISTYRLCHRGHLIESLSRRRFCQHGRQPEVNRAVIDGEWMRQPFSFEINNGSHSAFTFVISNENG